jgi:hypothetical protein
MLDVVPKYKSIGRIGSVVAGAYKSNDVCPKEHFCKVNTSLKI